jgi:hypothetical protein
MGSNSFRRALLRAGLAGALIAMLLATGVAFASGATGHASRATAYCSAFPIVEVPKEAWGFHGGQPIMGATGSYTRGHGMIDLSARTVSGIICQVDRVAGAPDRQIVLSVGRHLLYASHHAVMFGVPGNIMRIDVRVKSTTDPSCPVGTPGEATIFASYNGVHEDDVQYSFPAGCKSHRHRYTGPDVVTNVPPN